MMTERFTALELTVDRLQQRLAASEELAAATASQLASYKLAMPKARGYYALIQIPDNLSELHARRAVLEERGPRARLVPVAAWYSRSACGRGIGRAVGCAERLLVVDRG
jgi:hypothetical protein